jgi:hypothetical protein
MAKKHKRTATHRHAMRLVKRVRGPKAARAKKPVTRGDRVVRGAMTKQQEPQPYVENQLRKSPGAYAELATNRVEVMEIEVVNLPEDSLEADAVERALPEDGFYEDEE